MHELPGITMQCGGYWEEVQHRGTDCLRKASLEAVVFDFGLEWSEGNSLQASEEGTGRQYPGWRRQC